MRIVVINTAASSGGALSILKEFYQYIRENDLSNEWVFLLSDYYIEETDNIIVKVIKNSKNKFRRLKFDSFNGKRLIEQYNPDVVFSMQNTTVANLSVPQVLYLHQSIPFQKVKDYSFFKKEEYKYAFIQYLLGANIKYGLHRADKIIVQTKWMKDAIINQCNIDSSNIEVIPPSIEINGNFNKESKSGISKKFFYPSTSAPYKNNNLIDQACDYIDTKFPELQYGVDITVDENFNNKNIHSIGKITREEVFQKMNNEVLIFPSYIETYGLPLAEGKIFNSVILASKTPFAEEILRDYNNAYFFDPFDEQKLANLMISIIKGEIIKKDPVDKVTTLKNTWSEVHSLLLKSN